MRAIRSSLPFSLAVASLLAHPFLAQAAAVFFSGFDEQAAPADPRPNADAARSAFLAALGVTTVIDFENQAVGATAPLGPAPGVTISFVNQGGNTIFNGSNVDVGYNTTAGGSLFLLMGRDDDQASNDVVFSFATPVEAFGFFVTGPAGLGEGITRVLFNDGAPQSFGLNGLSGGGIGFFGFTSFGTPISTITIRTSVGGLGINDDVIGFDDVILGSAVPEPGALGLGIAAGGVLLPLLRRARGTRAAIGKIVA